MYCLLNTHRGPYISRILTLQVNPKYLSLGFQDKAKLLHRTDIDRVRMNGSPNTSSNTYYDAILISRLSMNIVHDIESLPRRISLPDEALEKQESGRPQSYQRRRLSPFQSSLRMPAFDFPCRIPLSVHSIVFGTKRGNNT